MRRVILVALLALALPCAASATSIDFTIGGTLNGTTVFTTGSTTVGGTFTITSQLQQINFIPVPLGKAVVSTGVIGAGGTFTNGSISVWDSTNALLFSGSFSGIITNSGGVITVMATPGVN